MRARGRDRGGQTRLPAVLDELSCSHGGRARDGRDLGIDVLGWGIRDAWRGSSPGQPLQVLSSASAAR